MIGQTNRGESRIFKKKGGFKKIDFPSSHKLLNRPYFDRKQTLQTLVFPSLFGNLLTEKLRFSTRAPPLILHISAPLEKI